MRARGKAASFAILLLAATSGGTGSGITAITAAEAAQAVATFRVGIRIVSVSASKAAPAAALTTARTTQAAAKAAPSSLDARTVIVQPGESLSTIAARIYGDAGRYMEIFEANRDILVSPDLLPAGTRLRLP